MSKLLENNSFGLNSHHLVQLKETDGFLFWNNQYFFNSPFSQKEFSAPSLSNFR